MRGGRGSSAGIKKITNPKISLEFLNSKNRLNRTHLDPSSVTNMQENGCHTYRMQENFTGRYRQYAGKFYCLFKKIAQSPSLARQRNFCKVGTQFRSTRIKTLKMLKQQ